MRFTWRANRDEGTVGLMTVEETRHHYPDERRGEKAKSGRWLGSTG
jgi:hypothetical protein